MKRSCLSSWIVISAMFIAVIGPAGSNSPLFAQDTAEKKDEKASIDVKEVSYVIGANIGRNLAAEKIEIDVAALAEGLTAAMKEDGKLRLTEEQMKSVMVEFGNYQREKAAKAREKAEKAKMNFLAENQKKQGVSVTKSGLQYRVLKEGAKEGASPGPTDKVTVHYHGTLTNGEVFDSSVDRGEPIEFGVNGVIKGWTEALQLMKEGDKWEIVLPPEIAYGARGAGDKIGPNEVLVFQVELIKVNR